MITGTVFDIKELSVYDGPGVRVTVFLKGCPLRCAWCHNPEGLSAAPQIMVSASCISCGSCRTECPLTGSADALKNTRISCHGCGECVSKCPNAYRSVVGKVYTPSDLAKTVMKNSVFFTDGGGVTFSGGEPTMQSEFLLETMKLLPIHKAIQTCGYCKSDIFKQVLDAVDFLFFDIKHVNDVEHKKYTGVSNRLILENLKQVIQSGKPFTVRIPLIKGVNDSSENLKATASLLKGASGLQRVELLPYNGAAGAKYQLIGKPFEHSFIAPATEDIDVSAFLSEGIECKIM